jgi:hypothetical protein
MSSPVCRTASEDEENRRVSPISAQMATESRPPMPKYSRSAEHPGWAMLNFDRSR